MLTYEYMQKAYDKGSAEAIEKCVEILSNYYEVGNAKQNAFMDMLIMEILRLKEQNQ